VLPVIIFVVIAIPLLLIAFFAVRRSNAKREGPLLDDPAARAELEREFAAAEAYEDKLRGEAHGHAHDKPS
jgi:hypothetical protein